MIYNLANYLITTFSTYNFVVNGFQTNTPNEAISISDTGGTPDHWYDRTEFTLQIMVRSVSNVTGKKVADSIYENLKNKFHWSLASVTVGGTIYPEITLAQISPLQTPGSVGADDEGRWLWSFNLFIVV